MHDRAEGQTEGQIAGDWVHLAAELAGAPATVQRGIPAAHPAPAAIHRGRQVQVPAARSSARALNQRASKAGVDVLAAGHHTWWRLR